MKGMFSLTALFIVIAIVVVIPINAATHVPGTNPQLSKQTVVAPSINPVVNEVGKISWSIDGLGVSGTTGTIQVEKPTGAKVKSAYMAAATTGYSSYKLLPGDIKIDGVNVIWINEIKNLIGSYNYWGDVTSLVKAKIDAAPAGRVDFTITETQTAKTDGELLVVIFNDPTQTTENTIILMFGAAQTTADDFDIRLAKPIDKTNPNLALDFSLASSYSYQEGSSLQHSIVDVNGQRLTSWAGGDDDGTGPSANGELFTVGGLDDSTDNPADPNAKPTGNKRYDDELYSLLPFVSNGDTNIEVHTQNPSNDDNILFAGLFLRSVKANIQTYGIGLFRPSTARWYLDYDKNGASDYQVTWGARTDKPVAGDWDGDGKDEIGLYRPSTQMWYLDYDNNGASDYRIKWGASTDIPVAGDWDGDGKDEIGLYRPSTQMWYLDYDNNGASDYRIKWGASTDIPVAGDWDGDGKDEIGLYRPSTQMWYLDYDNNGASDYRIKWGASTDIPVAGDWDGYGKDKIGLYRPSTQMWYLDYDNNGASDYRIKWGASTDIPVAGNWNGDVKKWTFMVYVCGDNNLEMEAIDDFLEMAEVGSTAEVNIVAQVDRIPGQDSRYGNWNDTKRFYITKSMTPTSANAVQDLGEANMGNPNTLSNFISWAKTNYPANNYTLVLWNHGNGWKRPMSTIPWEDNSTISGKNMLARGICYDDTNGDHLTLQETDTVLAGSPVTLHGNDACLMQMIEILHQLGSYSKITVGSEETVPGPGWPYDTILGDLTSTPTITPKDFGSSIVQRYIDSYAPATHETKSAVVNSDIPAIVTAIDSLAQALINVEPGYYTQVQQSRADACHFDDTSYIDLYDFARLIKLNVPDALVASAAQNVMDKISVSVYKEAHGTDHPNAHGISIYMPLTSVDLTSYKNTKFAIDTHWDEFLTKHYGRAAG